MTAGEMKTNIKFLGFFGLLKRQILIFFVFFHRVVCMHFVLFGSRMIGFVR